MLHDGEEIRPASGKATAETAESAAHDFFLLYIFSACSAHSAVAFPQRTPRLLCRSARRGCFSSAQGGREQRNHFFWRFSACSAVAFFTAARPRAAES